METIRLLIQWGGILALTTIILIALPHSKLRDFLMPICAGVLAVACGLYVISPLDIVPDVVPIAGWADDAVVGMVGIGSAIAAVNASKR